ncbi:MAG: LPS export ABC transporter periplasmic protein LptC [Halioglobus sp.]
MPRVYLQVLLALALLIAASYYLAPGSEPSPEVSARQKALPKTYLINVRSSNYDEAGALTEVIQADTATYYPSQNKSLLEEPRLYSHNLDNDTWSASAEIGHYEHGREMLTFTNNVRLTNDTNQVHLTTERMKIDLRKNMATSDVPVTITHGESNTRADGMVANLDAQILQLRPNVESIYVQPTP